MTFCRVWHDYLCFRTIVNYLGPLEERLELPPPPPLDGAL